MPRCPQFVTSYRHLACGISLPKIRVTDPLRFPQTPELQRSAQTSIQPQSQPRNHPIALIKEQVSIQTLILLSFTHLVAEMLPTGRRSSDYMMQDRIRGTRCHPVVIDSDDDSNDNSSDDSDNWNHYIDTPRGASSPELGYPQLHHRALGQQPESQASMHQHHEVDEGGVTDESSSNSGSDSGHKEVNKPAAAKQLKATSKRSSMSISYLLVWPVLVLLLHLWSYIWRLQDCIRRARDRAVAVART